MNIIPWNLQPSAAPAWSSIWALSADQRATAGGHRASTNVRKPRRCRSSGFQRVMLPILTKLGRHIARMLPPGTHPGPATRKIVLAGKQTTWNVEKAMALKALGLHRRHRLGALAHPRPYESSRTLTSILGRRCRSIMGYFAVDYYLDKSGKRPPDSRSSRRCRTSSTRSAVCVEAGLGFDAALHRVRDSPTTTRSATNWAVPCRTFASACPRSQALHSLLDRTDVPGPPAVRSCARSRPNGRVSRSLGCCRSKSDEVREKRRQAAEERAMKPAGDVDHAAGAVHPPLAVHRHHGTGRAPDDPRKVRSDPMAPLSARC